MVILSASYVFPQYKTGVRILTGSYYASGARNTLPYGGLDLFSDGTFTRASSGSFLMRAPTNGSTAFLSWADPNIRRVEDRGDGSGSLLLLEGARTNIVPYSRDMTNAGAWTAGVTTVTTGDYGAGPDGVTLADRIEVTAVGLSKYRTMGALSGTYVASAWFRSANGGTATARAALQNDVSAGIGGLIDTAITGTFSRLSASYFMNASGFWVPGDGRAWGGDPAESLDYIVDLHQIEAGYFPSSPIFTTTVAATRASDALTYAVGQYPASFLTAGFRFTIAPDFSSADIIAGADTAVLFGVAGGTNQVDIRKSGVTCILRVYSGGSALIGSSAFTFSRGQQLTFTIKPNAGQAIIAGATTGNGTHAGTGFTWTANTIRIGATSGGAGNSFGRFGRYIEAL
ncbi:MAG: hypothetical protein WC761_00460 [Candidatus Paceibacterota bacterium]|jgi:hypothetical protein